ncbi:MAG: glycosyltransferase family A protein [Patescibacteria group bacterium]
MISIIIPVYNQAQKIIKTLKSIAAQSYQDYEVIIVNDGSSDGVANICGKYLESLVTNQSYLFLNQANAGAPAARNRGAKEAKGNYLFFCDADAVLTPNALETLVRNLEANPSISYAYSSFLWGKKLFKLGEFDPEKLKKMPYIHTMSLIRRSDFPSLGWDESIKKLQDWDLWLTMLEQGKIGMHIPEILFTVTPGGTISSWVPSFAYKLMPFLPAVKKYKRAEKIIKEKHGL